MMDTTEREIFTAGLRRAAEESTAGSLDDALEAMGWADAFAADRHIAVSALFEAQGGAGATSTALAKVLQAGLGLDLADGTAFVLPPPGSAAVPAHVGTTDGHGPCVLLHGIGLCDLPRVSRAVVVAERDRTLWSAVVETSELAARMVDGIDPTMGLSELETHCVPALEGWSPVEGSWDDAVAVGRLAIAHELVGAMRTMLALAREHALDRIQFGRPISEFQAVRHRLAESLVAVEAAEGALVGAWSDGTPFTAMLAKAVAGNSARTVRRHCQQVMAGIGFTTEHDLHRYIRRTMVLDALLGDAHSLTEEIGRRLLAERRIPHLLPL